jgi:hypothetical protein
MACLVIISALVQLGDPEKLSLSPVEGGHFGLQEMIPPAPGCSLLITGGCLHLGMVCPVMALLFLSLGGQFLSLVVKMLLIGPVLSGTRGECRRETQSKRDGHNMEAEMPGCSPASSS